MARRIRKPLHGLSVADFEVHPCWEYASDEEGQEDECTVRPLALSELSDTTHQVFVQAAFFFPNGRVRLGMVTLNAGDDPSGHQPALFAPDGLFTFYQGAMEPRRSEVKRFVAVIKKISPIPFPVRYISALYGRTGEPLAAGPLKGLYWLVNWQTGELRAEV